MKTIEQELLKEILNYDSKTGIFTWKIKPALQIKIGDIAGSKVSRGYIHLAIKNKDYKAHRLAWIYMYGQIPEGYTIDHINGVCHDNRIENLRISPSQVEQGQNKKVFKNNTSGYTGVGKSHNKWQARIMLNRKSISLGYFDTPEAANDARIKAKAELHTFNPIQRTS